VTAIATAFLSEVRAFRAGHSALAGIAHNLEAGCEPIAALDQGRANSVDFPGAMHPAAAATRGPAGVLEVPGDDFAVIYYENNRRGLLDFMNTTGMREYR
jgi:glutamine synthetase